MQHLVHLMHSKVSHFYVSYTVSPTADVENNYTELVTNGGWSCKLADNFGLDGGETNDLFKVTEQGSDMMKAVFKED